nr:enoyl-CoA hydratase [Microthrixaceae bacterium]
LVGPDDVVFADVGGTRLGMCGLEYFGHPWEFGPRKAKELLLTGDSLDVHEAHRLGMVSKVFPRDELDDSTLDFARRIAELPTMTALMIKESVNQTVDNQGFTNALQATFTLHQLNHSHWAEMHDDGWPAARAEDGVASWKDAPPIVPAEKSSVRAAPGA